VIAPIGASRPNGEVFHDLAQRLGVAEGDTPENDAEGLMRVSGRMPERMAFTLLEQGSAEPPCGPAPIQFVDVFPKTADAKIDLAPATLLAAASGGLYGYRPDPATERYPLALISPASEKTISSSLGELRDRQVSMRMHPEDARARGIDNGDSVRVFNDLGEVHCLVTLTDEIRAGTVSLPKGLWRKSTLNRATANALAPDSLEELSGGACFNDARVEVTRILSASWADRSLALWTR
jgi:anaerobic selenocysteine-containing dehydrogenase